MSDARVQAVSEDKVHVLTVVQFQLQGINHGGCYPGQALQRLGQARLKGAVGLVKMLDTQASNLLWSIDQGPVQRAALQQVDDLVGAGPLLLAVPFAAVSYTHLTLPTKRIV